MRLQFFPVNGIGRIGAGDDLAALLLDGIEHSGLDLRDRDVLAVCQKVVSKAEGRSVDLRQVEPSAFARRIAATENPKDPRLVEVVLRETRRIVKMKNGHLIVETGPGWVCANAGVDASNSGDGESVILLPVDPDASARRLRERIRDALGCEVAVLITDTFGRPFREGLLDVALGVAGMEALLDLRERHDLDGRELQHTVIAQADALAAAAGLLMGKDAAVPAVVARGYRFEPARGSGEDLIRAPEIDLFR